MKFSDFYDKHSWRTLVVALVISLGLWYTVSVRDRIEAQFEIRLEFKGPPSNLIVTDGLVNKMTIRVQGPEALLRSVNSQTLVWVVNLEKIRSGANIIPLVPKDWSPNFRAFEIIDVNPPRLVVHAENLVERTIPLVPHIKTGLDKDIIAIKDLRLTPETITVRGPESHIASLKSVPVTVRIEPTATQGAHKQEILLEVPPLITAVPGATVASYDIRSTRTIVTLDRAIIVEREEKGPLEISPRTLSVRVEVPENLSNDRNYLKKLQLKVNAPPMSPDKALSLPLEVSMPKGMTLAAPLPDSITVTKLKK